MERQFGRLEDGRNHAGYHLMDNKPVTDNYPTMEHLAKVAQIKDSEGVLINRMVGFSQQLGPLRTCLSAYGYESQDQHQVFQVVLDLEGVSAQLSKVLAIREEKTAAQKASREKTKHQREEEISLISQSIENNKKFTVTEGG